MVSDMREAGLGLQHSKNTARCLYSCTLRFALQVMKGFGWAFIDRCALGLLEDAGSNSYNHFILSYVQAQPQHRQAIHAILRYYYSNAAKSEHAVID